jgi:hypothetical protein
MKSGVDAAKTMQEWSKAGKTGVKGLCLKTCRLAWGIPAKFPSAISAWDNASTSSKNTNPLKAPVGYPHFFRGGKYGHIVIQSDKPGMVWSTDLPNKDKIGLVSWDETVKKWGFKYLGWTTELNGQKLK